MRAKTQKINFIFRQKQDTNYRKNRQKYQPLSNLPVAPGTQIFLSNINITKHKGFGKFNLAAYWKRKYNHKVEKEPWYLLTNLENLEEVIQIYRSRMGIEAMFKDCKTGGYNLEGSRANTQRLTNLILLIAIAYTASSYHGNCIKKSGYQRYICRLKESGRKDRRHSNFWVGMYGDLWVITWEYLFDIVQDMMNFSPQKKSDYQRGLKALSIEYTI
ncbi:MAG: transposase [Okeania sp. SIO3B3]|nr:transposase [Okeania sp. SIO3B3]